MRDWSTFVSLMHLATLACSCVLIWRAISLTRGMFWSLSYCRQSHEIKSGRDANLVIVVPYFQEQSACEESLAYFVDLWGADHRVHSIVCATAARENDELHNGSLLADSLAMDIAGGRPIDVLVSRYGGAFPIAELQKLRESNLNNKTSIHAEIIRIIEARISTRTLLVRAAEYHNARLGRSIVQVVEEPGSTGNRATQINYALGIVSRSESVQKRITFFGMYDVDSRPAKETLDEVAERGAHGALAMQQATLYLENLNRFSTRRLGGVMACDAIMQTIWSLGYELPNWKIATDQIRSPTSSALLRRPTYGTGHGTWIQADLWARLNGLSEGTPAAGMFLGYSLGRMGIPLEPMVTIDSAEVPTFVRQLISQHKLWFAGGMQVVRLLNFRQQAHVISTRSEQTATVAMVLKELVIQIRWIFGPWLVVACIAANAILPSKYPWLMLIVICALFNCSFPVVVFFRSKSRISSLTDREYSLDQLGLGSLLIGSIIRAFVRCLGPTIWLCSTIWATATGKKLKFRKVAR